MNNEKDNGGGGGGTGVGDNSKQWACKVKHVELVEDAINGAVEDVGAAAAAVVATTITDDELFKKRHFVGTKKPKRKEYSMLLYLVLS